MGIIAAIVIGYVQIVFQHRQVKLAETVALVPPPARSIPEFAEYSLFSPEAIFQGIAVGFRNRTVELRALERAVRDGKSVLVLEGLPGVGKTLLAAALCSRLQRQYRIRWLSGRERRDATLGALVAGLAYDPALPSSRRLQAVAGSAVDWAVATDELIEYLVHNRIIIVFDDYYLLTDEGIHRLVRKLQRSKIRSVALLTSRRHPAGIERLPLVESRQVTGFSRPAAREYLRDHGIREVDEVLDRVWHKAGQGIPEAMRILAGLTRGRDVTETLDRVHAYTADLTDWIARLYADLEPTEQDLAKVISFSYAPAGLDLLREVVPNPDVLSKTLDSLLDRFILVNVGDRVHMHSLLCEYIRRQVTPAERDHYSGRIVRYYQRRARKLLLGMGEQPSYGRLYLESFPDYVNDTASHAALIDDLLDRLGDHELRPGRGARLLVLGAGNGIHDPALAAHGLRVVNLDIEPDIATLGHQQTQAIAGEFVYVVADMTRPLPFAAGSFDAVFNIGSSFGYEERDEDNAAVFRNAAEVLKPGGPFVFEYVNGAYWQEVRGGLETETVTLPTGSVRTTYAVFDPSARTSLASISLRRSDGSTGWFHHFMHYYRLGEITAMMRASRLTPVAVYGATNSRVREPFDEKKSSAMVVIATKNAAEPVHRSAG